MKLTGRVLLFSDVGRVLLVGSRNPRPGGPTVWVAPGGSAEHGETAREAASRELLEEVGVRVAPEQLAGPVGTSVATDGRFIEYFVLPLEDGFIPTAYNPDVAERDVWVGFHWWTADELEQTTDVVWPVELPNVLRERDALLLRARPWVFDWKPG